MIDSMKGSFSVSELCEALDVSRSGYHAACARPAAPRAQANERLLARMRAIHSHRHTHCYGSPRMARELQDAGSPCSVNRVARVMRAAGLRVQARSAYRPRTTQVDHAAAPSPNLLAQAGCATMPGTHLVSDITYIPTKEGWLYLAVVIDLFSRSILGWSVAETLHATIVTDALQRAMDGGQVAPGALFHSDRGSQYSAALTRSCLARCGLRQSMSAKGYCYDNAFAESAFASLKSELLDEGRPFPSKQAASRALFDYLACFYNRKRLHSSLGYLSPQNFLNLYFQSQKTHLN
jgi:putative transposase